MRKGVTTEPEAIEDVMTRADTLWLAIADDEGPYSIPVNFAYVDGTIYLHSGRRGRKAAALDSGAPVAFSTAVDVRMRPGGDDACDQGYRFRSVSGRGTPRLTRDDEKMKGLDAITVKHLGKKRPYAEKALPITNVYAIDIDTVTARIKE